MRESHVREKRDRVSCCWEVMIVVLHAYSMNPEIDVGQVEGAFVMGLGYFLTEKLEFDLETGEPKTINTWV